MTQRGEMKGIIIKGIHDVGVDKCLGSLHKIIKFHEMLQNIVVFFCINILHTKSVKKVVYYFIVFAYLS